MVSFRRIRSISAVFAKGLLAFAIIALALVGAGLGLAQTGWAKDQLRALIVRQANEFLTARLEIGALRGSLIRGIELDDVSLSRDGEKLVTIERVSVSYSIRELTQPGVVIKRLSVVRPTVVARRDGDGRWDLATLVKRNARDQQRTGPTRPIEFVAIDVTDARVILNDPLTIGGFHVPTRYESLNASFSFKYEPVKWTLNFTSVSFRGAQPELSVDALSGGIDSEAVALAFRNLSVRTPRSAFAFTGRVDRGASRPTELVLQVHADRFAFQEWQGVVSGLNNLALDAAFDTTLAGPLTSLQTDIRLTSTAGSIAGRVALNTRVPGWHGEGAVDVARIDLAKWLNKPAKVSDISGRVTFNLDFGFGQHFPRGEYVFAGPHVTFVGYAADNVRARGTITAKAALVEQATAVAYGSDVTVVNGSIGVEEPFLFSFTGTARDLDLRRVPPTIPVPLVESTLSFAYDITGRFSDPFLVGRATFTQSTFLGATIGDGTVGTLDTGAEPVKFSGDGTLEHVDVARFGEGLDVAWMREPRYHGEVSGRFQVEGSGTDRQALILSGHGQNVEARVFDGRVAGADVGIEIEHGTLRTTFNGKFDAINPAIAFIDGRFEASLSGVADVRTNVRDVLLRETVGADYDIEGSMTLDSSVIRGVSVERLVVDGAIRDNVAMLTRVDVAGTAIAGQGSGQLALSPDGASSFDYDITHADLAALRSFTPVEVSGVLATRGHASGDRGQLHLAGDATLTRVEAADFTALGAGGQYDVTFPMDDLTAAAGRSTINADLVTAFGQSVDDVSGNVSVENGRVGFDTTLTKLAGRSGALSGVVVVNRGRRAIDVSELALTFGGASWRLVNTASPSTVTWNDDEIAVAPPLRMTGGAGSDSYVDIGGTWRSDGRGALHLVATHVFLETLQNVSAPAAPYGGILDLDATIRGTRAEPIVTGRVTIANGRVQRVAYDRLEGRVDYTGGMFDIDLHLQQSPGVAIDAVGTVPDSLFDREMPERPIHVTVKSDAINLGLLEGVTGVVRDVAGRIALDVTVIGTSRDPHFEGSVDVSDAAFLAVKSGARYTNARAAVRLSSDRITVETLHIEDARGDPLDVRGSLATHELTVGDLAIDITARRFDALQNQFGELEVDAALQLRGQFERPRLTGDLTISRGDLKVDAILERALFEPYATAPLAIAPVDAVAALNPWDRMLLNLTLHVPTSTRMSGENVQVTRGTPIGLGDINLRVGGDLYLYKDPGQPLSITGSLDSIGGTYAFQGRRFDVDPAGSSINFRGDLIPNIYVTVNRLVSGVETRITVSGDLMAPELILASTPPLDSGDILSLIVFNRATNDLSAAQQEELAVRAGTLAVAFVATPVLSAIQRSLGLEALEVDAIGDLGGGPKITIGEELAPGLVARFTREFGQDPYNEASIEYYLSRLLRIRATFSDAQSLIARSQFRRVERAGIDLLLFFSF